MDNQIQQILDIVNSATPEDGFLTGIYFTAAVIVIYIIIRVVFAIFSRGKKRCHGISILSDNGQLYITTNAISDLIKSMKSSFTHITINRVDITRKSGTYVLDLLITFDMNGGGLTNQVSLLREKIIVDLKSIFGIETVSEINVKLKKTIRPNIKQQQPALTPATEKKESKIFTTSTSSEADYAVTETQALEKEPETEKEINCK